MSPDTLAAFRSHAAESLPRECCGLVVIVKGKEQYWPCRNLDDGTDHFRMSPDDLAAAEDAGEIVGLCHSHPDCIEAVHSEADRVVCETFGRPSHVLAWPADKLATIEPVGYRAPLVGRQFFYGVLDCWTLVQDFYREEFSIELPRVDSTDGWWNRGENVYLENLHLAKLREVRGEPRRGDVIFMQIRSSSVNHAAVYLGDGVILHHLYGRLSSRDVYGGYWLERTRLITRHESQL